MFLALFQVIHNLLLNLLQNRLYTSNNRNTYEEII